MNDAQNGGSSMTQEANFYGILHLLPSAPQDLVIEVYWHLVSLRMGDGDGARLRELNAGYEAILKGLGAKAALADSPDALQRREDPRGRKIRAFRRPEPALSPMELLHVLPDAPQDVLDLAHRYWHVQLRHRVDAEARLEELDRAYAALRERRAIPAPPTEAGEPAEAAPQPPAPITPMQTAPASIEPAVTPAPEHPARGVSMAKKEARPVGTTAARLSHVRMSGAAAFVRAGRSTVMMPSSAVVGLARAIERRRAARRASSTISVRERLRIITSGKKQHEPVETGPDPKIEERFSSLASHEEHGEQFPPDAKRNSSA